jgi:hypothetical protein
MEESRRSAVVKKKKRHTDRRKMVDYNANEVKISIRTRVRVESIKIPTVQTKSFAPLSRGL